MLWSISVIQHHLKWFLDGLGPSFEQYWGTVGWRLWPTEHLQHFLPVFEIAAFWAKFASHLLRCFCGPMDSYSPIYILLKIWKLWRRDSVRLRLLETDTWHCLGYLFGTDLVKLSWRSRFKPCTSKFGDDLERVGDLVAILPIFIWGRRSVVRRLNFFVGLPTIFSSVCKGQL